VRNIELIVKIKTVFGQYFHSITDENDVGSDHCVKANCMNAPIQICFKIIRQKFIFVRPILLH